VQREPTQNSDINLKTSRDGDVICDIAEVPNEGDATEIEI
jgi:hypothetical protein